MKISMTASIIRLRWNMAMYYDGTTREDILDSKNDVYYSPRGVVRVFVGKSRILFLGKR